MKKRVSLLVVLALLLCMIPTGAKVKADEPTSVTFDFTSDETNTDAAYKADFATWGNSYSSHTVEYEKFTVEFKGASKQSSTITNMPVAKGNSVVVKAKDGVAITGVSITAAQWGTKAKTIVLKTSTDGTNFTATEVSSTTFSLSASTLPTGTKAVEFDLATNSGSQVGIQSITVTYTTDSGSTSTPTPDYENMTQAQIIEAATALDKGDAFTAPVTLQGTISEITTAYSEQYGNISFNLKVTDDFTILCYRTKNGSELKVGDVVKVTGIVKNYNGTIQFDKDNTYEMVQAAADPTDTPIPTPDYENMTQAEIIEAATALDKGAAFTAPVTLQGTISEITTAYSEQYGNISFSLKVTDDFTILCFRTKNGSELKVGDVVKVTGTIKNYNGTIEFDTGNTYEMVQAAADPTDTPTPTPDYENMTQAQIIEAATALDKGAAFTAPVTLQGTIEKIKTEYSEQYDNITFVLKVTDSFSIDCFRTKKGAELKVGDVVKVTGTIKNYNGTIEFDTGNTYEMVQAAPDPTDTPTPTPDFTGKTQAEIMEAAEALAAGDKLGAVVDLTGKVTKIDEAYTDQYQNITVTIKVDGTDKELLCYRIKGDEASKVKVGDTITVHGMIMKYQKNAETAPVLEFATGSTLAARTPGAGNPAAGVSSLPVVFAFAAVVLFGAAAVVFSRKRQDA